MTRCCKRLDHSTYVWKGMVRCSYCDAVIERYVAPKKS